MSAELTSNATRASEAAFVQGCSLWGLQERLPLRWPTPPDTPPSPKRNYRFCYTHQGWEDLLDPATWEYLSDFDWVLRLIDLEGLRPVLAQRLGWTSAQGKKPFDPVLMFLFVSWRLTNGWTRAQALRNLRNPRYADYVQRFGFVPGDFPTTSPQKPRPCPAKDSLKNNSPHPQRAKVSLSLSKGDFCGSGRRTRSESPFDKLRVIPR